MIDRGPNRGPYHGKVRTPSASQRSILSTLSLSQTLALFAVLLRQLCNCRSSCRLAILQSTRELFLPFWFKMILSLNRTYFYLLRAFQKVLKISNMTFKAVLFFSEIFRKKIKAKMIPDVKLIEQMIASFTMVIFLFENSCWCFLECLLW